jgi:hypothetical protein
MTKEQFIALAIRKGLTDAKGLWRAAKMYDALVAEGYEIVLLADAT